MVWLDSAQAERDLGVLVTAAEHEPAVCPGGQKGRWHPGLDQEWCGQQEQGGIGEATPRVQCPVLGPRFRKDIETLEHVQRQGWIPNPERILKVSSSVSKVKNFWGQEGKAVALIVVKF
ncbi:hypothetical protein HGM15179_013213 [Zosterops borbonicus]|uniref:Uncharacterized protein n=1 Tax=Zosterops borbonicus TaxID=364589 RepID=A0A8K1G909_9PASS|nr:hypothetical protein HGM15179_013213 [Zosterops borbonicus]